MRLKKLYFSDQFFIGDYSGFAGTTRSDSSFSPVAEKDASIRKRGYSAIRLHDMEVLNKNLEEQVSLLNKKLADAKATSTKFISIIAHDLRSPFNAIIGFLEIMKENLKEYRKDEFEEYVAIACDSAYNTLDLIDSLLTWSISQSKKTTICPVRINLRELLAEEICKTDTAAALKEIKIISTIPDNLYVGADLQMARAIMRNLICNSIKFTNRGGEISVAASERNSLVEISVKDNGVGIPSKTLQSLFKVDSFHSAYGTNNEKGTGLGLIICKEFIERNGGKIRVESEQGKGCETIFTLPLFV